MSILTGSSYRRYLNRRRLLLQMKAEDLDEVASLILERLASESSTAVVCGSDMVKKLKPLKLIALPM